MVDGKEWKLWMEGHSGTRDLGDGTISALRATGLRRALKPSKADGAPSPSWSLLQKWRRSLGHLMGVPSVFHRGLIFSHTWTDPMYRVKPYLTRPYFRVLFCSIPRYSIVINISFSDDAAPGLRNGTRQTSLSGLSLLDQTL